jgi:hypothetical protein
MLENADTHDMQVVFGSAQASALQHLARHMPNSISLPCSDYTGKATTNDTIHHVKSFWERPSITDAKAVCKMWQKADIRGGIHLDSKVVGTIDGWLKCLWRDWQGEPDNFELPQLRSRSRLHEETELEFDGGLDDPMAEDATKLACELAHTLENYLGWVDVAKAEV